MSTKKTKDKLLGKGKKKRKRKWLSTGSSLLNMACTGQPERGFRQGHYYLIVGDSASGKTFLSLTCLAEATINTDFDKYRFIYDNAEDGALMNIERFFGKKVSQKMEPPSLDPKNKPIFSTSVEEFYYHVDDALDQKKPFIYILDSMDSLTSKPEKSKFKETKTADRKEKQITGSFGDGKAKINASNLRRLMSPLGKSGSILIIITQTHDNLAFGFEKKTRSGGHALRFYACLEIWSSVAKKLKKTVRGKARQVGISCKLQVKKNRVNGKEASITIPIYHSYGFDDMGSLVDYLLEEGHWSGRMKKLEAPEFDFKGNKEALIDHIESTDSEQVLIDLAYKIWKEISDKCELKRKKRYE
jgi:RecA/RadA recombinase